MITILLLPDMLGAAVAGVCALAGLAGYLGARTGTR